MSPRSLTIIYKGTLSYSICPRCNSWLESKHPESLKVVTVGESR